MKRFLCLALALLCLTLPVFGEEFSSVPEETASRLEVLFRKYSTLGASVALFENGRITYVYTYGTAWPGGDAITWDTGFQVGSISKMVSNIGLLQLMDREGIGLEDEWGDVLGFPVRHPQYPNTPVTFRQLMTHTASLRDSGDYDDAVLGKKKGVQELLTTRSAYTFYMDSEPGLKREYSNLGGGLIGVFIEKLSGQTLDEYMQQHVFEPLGILAAYHASTLGEQIPLADMYTMPEKYLAKSLRRDETTETEPDWTLCYTSTAGSLIISAPDLCKILIALCDGGVYENTRILSASLVEEMLTKQDYIGSVACETGNGLFVNILTDDQVEGRTLYGHGGKAYGMLCAAYFDPTDRTGVVMLTNGCDNSVMYRKVTGMLGREVCTLCYEELIDPGHQTQDPFLMD